MEHLNLWQLAYFIFRLECGDVYDVGLVDYH